MSDHVPREAECFSRNIEAQIEARRGGSRKLVLHGGALCSMCLANAPLPGQRYCGPCHRAYNAAWRKRRREKDLAVRAELARLRELENTLEKQQEERRAGNDHTHEDQRAGISNSAGRKTEQAL